MQDNFCLKTSAIWQFVGYGLYALKILVPLIIIILGVIDFSKATLSSDDKAISKAATTLIQRLILGIAIFLIPTIVNLVLNLVKESVEVVGNTGACYTCLLDPNSSECDSYKKEAEALRKQQ